MTEYDIIISDEADIDVDRIYLRYGKQSLASAERWRERLTAALASLQTFPNRCSAADEDKDYPDVTVRRLLYGKYRILFHVIEAQDEQERGTVRVLRILHGASGPAASQG